MREEEWSRVPRVALAVDSFLGYTMSWIYRQVTGGPSRVSLVLCGGRDCIEEFPFQPVVSYSDRTPRLLRKIRGKLWAAFKHFPPRFSPARQAACRDALREHDIQLVHAHFGTTASHYAPLCRELGIPLVVTVHGHDISSSYRRWPAYARVLRGMFTECPFFIVISEEMKQRLSELGCPDERIRVSYLGVPVEEFPFIDRSDRNGPVHFLHAGRLAAKKGVPDLVRAFAQAFPNVGAAVLDIGGDGEEKELIESAITEAAPANPVNMLGRLSVDELAAARTQADVFVLNCRVDQHGTKEGLPISTLEAACTGLPTVSTYHAGIPESIRHEETGLLVDEFDQDGLVCALRRMADRETRLRMGQAARVFMEEQFAIEKCNARLGELYREAVEINAETLKC